MPPCVFLGQNEFLDQRGWGAGGGVKVLSENAEFQVSLPKFKF